MMTKINLKFIWFLRFPMYLFWFEKDNKETHRDDILNHDRMMKYIGK